MRATAVLAAAASLIGCSRLQKMSAQSSPVSGSGDFHESLSFDGLTRTYLLHVPPAVANGQPLPLVIALHGGGGTGEGMENLIHMKPIADQNGFLISYPDGIDKGWNDGRSGVPSTAHTQNIDDAGFIEAMIDQVAAMTPLDTTRVYATGISNGAMMSGWLACNAADRIAAVGIVAGTGPDDLAQVCEPSRPVAMITFNGTADPLVPYNGGEVNGILPGVTRGAVASVASLKQFWVSTDGCNPDPTTTNLPDLDTSDGSTVVREAYAGCQQGTGVVFYRIDGGGHTWPGGTPYLPARIIGTVNRDIDASELIWAFFAQHPMQ